MFDFLLSWFDPAVTSGAKRKGPPLKLNTSIISAPIISRYSPFQDSSQPSPGRAGPSNIAWLRTRNREGDEIARPLPILPPPAVVQAHETRLHQIGRSVSLPLTSSPPFVGPAKKNIRLHVNLSSHSLHQDYSDQSWEPRPLSPIIEQEYFSPISLRKSDPLPSATSKTPCSVTSNTHPFISRSLKPSLSSSSTHSSMPPCIPTLDLSPPFPGPHRRDSFDAHLRPRNRSTPPMPTITSASDESAIESQGPDASSRASLHAESFVTASDSIHIELPSPEVRQSASESWIQRRWDRDLHFGSQLVGFHQGRKGRSVTPAFCAFWLGFICPVLWLVGGWKFTLTRSPAGNWWNVPFVGRKRRTGKQRSDPLSLPRWTDDKPTAGYPFVDRPKEEKPDSRFFRAAWPNPNRYLDQIYVVKAPSGPHQHDRILDPWIQRCRYAFCYAFLIFGAAFCAGSITLFILFSRDL
ncbi:hypothetical protein C8J56DRAFT_429306 [Mycena floridula]|nr:hypothetical protein C8J56DRAFT_429306 [Mycena floridula]